MIASAWERLAQRRATKAGIKTQEVLIFNRMLTMQHAP